MSSKVMIFIRNYHEFETVIGVKKAPDGKETS